MQSIPTGGSSMQRPQNFTARIGRWSVHNRKKAKGVDEVSRAPQVSADQHSALVTFDLPGTDKTASKNVVGSLAAVAAAQKAHPDLRVEEIGDESMAKEQLEQSNKEMGKST